MCTRHPANFIDVIPTHVGETNPRVSWFNFMALKSFKINCDEKFQGIWLWCFHIKLFACWFKLIDDSILFFLIFPRIYGLSVHVIHLLIMNSFFFLSITRNVKPFILLEFIRKKSCLLNTKGKKRSILHKFQLYGKCPNILMYTDDKKKHFSDISWGKIHKLEHKFQKCHSNNLG